jgi:uncharacterized protein YecE (DUF72 family)
MPNVEREYYRDGEPRLAVLKRTDPEKFAHIRQLLIGEEIDALRDEMNKQHAMLASRFEAHVRQTQQRFVQVRDNFAKVQKFLAAHGSSDEAAERRISAFFRAEMAKTEFALERVVTESVDESHQVLGRRIEETNRALQARARRDLQQARDNTVSKQTFAAALKQIATHIENIKR